MSKWYLDENDRDIYFKDDKDIRWDYNTKELVRILNDLETKLAEVKNSCDYYMKRSNDLVCEIGEYKKHIRFKGKEITELKQQLAEKEKKIEKLKSENHALISENAYQEADVFEFNSRIEQLQKQLAEKEKVIEIHKSAIRKMNRNCDTVKCQNKISFAVEQLEKTRQSFIYNYNDDICCVDPYDNHCCLSLTTTIYNNTIDIFNNQIKQLKEGE